MTMDKFAVALFPVCGAVVNSGLGMMEMFMVAFSVCGATVD